MKFREIIRQKQALTREECDEVLRGQLRGVLSVIGDGGYPYGVPMNYLYTGDYGGRIYFHSGKTGHKVDSLLRCDKVCFTVYDEGRRNPGEWSLNIKSVIVFGRVRIVDDLKQVEDICRKLSLKFTDDLTYIDKEVHDHLSRTLCFELIPEHITGKLINEA